MKELCASSSLSLPPYKPDTLSPSFLDGKKVASGNRKEKRVVTTSGCRDEGGREREGDIGNGEELEGKGQSQKYFCGA